MKKQLDNASPARLYATLVGGALVIGGVIGFFYNGHFGSGADAFGSDQSVKVFGILAVNGWHNLFHIATGLIGLAVAGYAARQYALAVGLLYLVLAVWGFVLGSGHNLLGIIPANTEDNFLHLLLGLLGLGAGAATQDRPRRPGGQAPGRSARSSTARQGV